MGALLVHSSRIKMESVDPEALPIHNLAGAIIFVGYVLAALLLTILIISDLYHAYQSRCSSYTKRSPYVQLQVFGALAALSFSTLSYHMLSYLVYSYQDWARSADFTTIKNRYDLLTGAGLESIWHWLIESTLFKHFAETICMSAANFWWTQGALLVTMASALFISIEGEKDIF